MKTSDSLKAIAPALLEAQKQITFALKDSVNPHFKNRYADVSAVIEAVKGPLNKNGITFLQSLSDVQAGETRQRLTTRLLHSSGEWIEDTASCPLPKADPQGVGSATTYLRRFSLCALLGVPQEDDDAEGAVQRTPVAAPTKKVEPAPQSMSLRPDTEKQLRFLAGAPKSQSFVEQAMTAKGYSDIAEFPEETAVKCIAWVEQQMKSLKE